MGEDFWGHPGVFVVPGSDVDISLLNQDDLYLSLPKKDIPQLAADYVKKLEAATTKDWCKCEWLVHPDDVNVRAMHCRECQHLARNHWAPGGSDVNNPVLGNCMECSCEEYKDRRVRKGAESPECPIHTRVGFILGFFLWVYRDQR